jgi:cytochrome c biogenesis protein CcmG, thiol:disulfide interchange protein DsbE
MKKKLLWLFLLAIMIALLLFFAQGLKQDPHLLPSTRINQPAPAFSLPTLNQHQYMTEKIFLHHLSLLIVFASWCESCAQEQAYLFAFKKQHPSVQLIGLNYQDDPTAAKAWLKQYGNPFTQILEDVNGSTAMDYGVYGTPEIFLINPQGKVLAKHVGALDDAAVQKNFQDFLATPIDTHSANT